MINRNELHDVQRALAELEIRVPVGSLGVLEDDETDTLIQIVELAVIPTGKPLVPVEAKLTPVIVYRVVGRLPLGRTSSTVEFPRIYLQGPRGPQQLRYEVAYLNLDAKK